jgi:DNA-binding response OmpR family regulator
VSNVIVAQSNAGLLKQITQVLAKDHLNVDSVADGPALLKKVEMAKPDLLLLDFSWPFWKETLKSLHDRGDHIPVVMVGNSEQARTLNTAVLGGELLFDHVTKPLDQTDLLVRVRRVLERTKPRLSLQVPLGELHDRESGRIDAKEVADYLGVSLKPLAKALDVSYATAHKTPAAPALQKNLRPIKRSLELISRMTRSRQDARAWLNNPHPDLGDETPLEVILSGRAGALVTLLENAMAGIPS